MIVVSAPFGPPPRRGDVAGSLHRRLAPAACALRAHARLDVWAQRAATPGSAALARGPLGPRVAAQGARVGAATLAAAAPMTAPFERVLGMGCAWAPPPQAGPARVALHAVAFGLGQAAGLATATVRAALYLVGALLGLAMGLVWPPPARPLAAAVGAGDWERAFVLIRSHEDELFRPTGGCALLALAMAEPSPLGLLMLNTMKDAVCQRGAPVAALRAAVGQAAVAVGRWPDAALRADTLHLLATALLVAAAAGPDAALRPAFAAALAACGTAPQPMTAATRLADAALAGAIACPAARLAIGLHVAELALLVAVGLPVAPSAIGRDALVRAPLVARLRAPAADGAPPSARAMATAALIAAAADRFAPGVRLGLLVKLVDRVPRADFLPAVASPPPERLLRNVYPDARRQPTAGPRQRGPAAGRAIGP